MNRMSTDFLKICIHLQKRKSYHRVFKTFFQLTRYSLPSWVKSITLFYIITENAPSPLDSAMNWHPACDGWPVTVAGGQERSGGDRPWAETSQWRGTWPTTERQEVQVKFKKQKNYSFTEGQKQVSDCTVNYKIGWDHHVKILMLI